MFLLTTKKTIFALVIIILSFGFIISPFQWVSAGTHEMADSIDIVNPGGHAGGAFGQATKLSVKEQIDKISWDVFAALPFYVYMRESRVMKYGSGTYPEGQERLDTFEAIILHGKNKLEDVSYVPYSQRPIGKAIGKIKGFDVVQECYDSNNNPVDAHYTGTSIIDEGDTLFSRICISLNGIKRNNISNDHLFGYLLPIVLHEIVHRIERTERANELAEYISNAENQPESINLQTLKRQWAERLQRVRRLQFIVDDIINNPENLCEKYQWLYNSIYANSSHIPYIDDNFLMAEPIVEYTYGTIPREIVSNSIKVCILSDENPTTHIKPGYHQEAMFGRSFRQLTVKELSKFFEKNNKRNLSEYEFDYDVHEDVSKDNLRNLPIYKLTTLHMIQSSSDIIENAKKIKAKFLNFISSASEIFGKEYQFKMKAPANKLAYYFYKTAGYKNEYAQCRFKINLQATHLPSNTKSFQLQEFRIKSLRNLSSNDSVCQSLSLDWNEDASNFLSRVTIDNFDEFKSYIVSPKSKGGR